MKVNKRFSYSNFVKTLFFMFVFTSSYSQYVFYTNSLPEKMSLHSYTTVADVGQDELDIQYGIKKNLV